MPGGRRAATPVTPLGPDAQFLCVDRGGEGNNLEEFFFDVPWQIRSA